MLRAAQLRELVEGALSSPFERGLPFRFGRFPSWLSILVVENCYLP